MCKREWDLTCKMQKKKNKTIRGKGAGKLIRDLIMYYKLAIRRNAQTNVEIIKNEIWSTFFHKISINENPKHQYCPPESFSWCTSRHAKAKNQLESFNHELLSMKLSKQY